MASMNELIRLSWGLPALMATQAVLGLVFASEYRDAEWVRAVWFGNDWITLVIAVPLFATAIVTASRRSVLGVISWLGMLGYTLYNYAFYLFGASLNSFFPIYVATLVLSSVLLLISIRQLPTSHIENALKPGAPVRILGGTYATIGGLLALVWLVFWARYVFMGQTLPVEREAFQVVASLDLALMVPALIAGGTLLWRKEAWGYVVAAIAGIQGTLYLFILSFNSILAVRWDLVEAPGEVPIWGSLLIVLGAATMTLLLNVRRGVRIGENPNGLVWDWDG